MYCFIHPIFHSNYMIACFTLSHTRKIFVLYPVRYSYWQQTLVRCGSICCMPYLQTHAGILLVHYTCCQDGQARDNIQQWKPCSTQRRTSSRMLGDPFCLARRTGTENLATNELIVTYTATLTNHYPSVKETWFLPVPQSVRKAVTDKFVQGVSIEK